MAEKGFLSRTATAGGTSIPYVVYVPRTAPAGSPLPVILFLHGAGERGTDGFRQTAIGLGAAIRWNQERFPALVVFPQAPPEKGWHDVAPAVMGAVDQTLREFDGDPGRVYLTGISLGGYGTWHFAMAYPHRFAAVVVVCGGILKPPTAVSVVQSPLTEGSADPYVATAAKVGSLPIWIFHGTDDPIIPVTESRRMHEQLKNLGADVRYTEYPGVGHGAWDRAYDETELWEWLFRQKRR